MVNNGKLSEEIRVRVTNTTKKNLGDQNISAIVRPLLIKPALFKLLTDNQINIPETLTDIFTTFFNELDTKSFNNKKLPKHITITFDLVPIKK